MSHVLWFAGLLGLVVAATVASGRGRARATEVVGRGVAAIAAIAYAALVVSAVWLWGGQDASEGRADRLRAGATVSVTIEGTRLPISGAKQWTIGHGIGADVRVPGDGGAELARIVIDERGMVSVLANAAGPSTRLGSLRTDALGGPLPHPCRESGATALELPAQAQVLVVECDGAREADAWVVRRDASNLVVSPLAIGRGRLAPEQRTLHAGDALRIGSSADALPNLVTWDVPAGSGTASMLAIPLDPTNCSAWATSGGSARATERGCAIDVGAFALSAITFVPDAEGVLARNAWVALLVGASPLIALLVFAVSPRRGRGARAFGRALRLAVLGGGLVALGCWRLLWAHRIDMGDPGTRVDANTLGILAIGASLAGNAVLSLDALDGRGWVRRAFLALLGWSAWLVASVLVTGQQPAITTMTVGVLGLSAIAATVPVLAELAGRWRMPPEVGLLAVAAAAVVARSVGMRGALVKLGLAYATVLLGHAALRALLAWPQRNSPVEPEEPRTTATAAKTASLKADTKLGLGALSATRTTLVPASEREADATVLVLDEQPEPGDGPVVFDDANVDERTSVATRARSADLDTGGVRRAMAKVGESVDSTESADEERSSWRDAVSRFARVAGPATTGIVRRAVLLGALLAAVGALAMLDAGVTLAIAGVGLALAMLVAGHDAIYDSSTAGRLGLLEREHARLLSAHGLAIAGLAIGVGTAAALASDRALLEGGAVAMLHAPLVAAGLFAVAALVARTHRRSWAPWVVAALSALAVWGMREAILERAMAGDGVASRRVAAVVEPGYALLRDDHAFVANASAWREASAATTPGSDDVGPWRGQGYFGAAIRDPGVAHSIDNDYLAVLLARETGVAGLLQSVMLLLSLVIGTGAIASARLPHASREQRARWLVTGVAGVLVVYQPLAALGIVPLTGLTWPGLGIDSPGELWLFVIGAVWCMQGAEPALADRAARADERVRGTPRLSRARRLVLIALVACGMAAVALVVRAGVCALSRANDDDDRVTAALAYANTLACPTPDVDVATIDDALPAVIAGKPTDGATARYERELLGTWRDQRGALARALSAPPLPELPAEGTDPWLDAKGGEADPVDDTVRRARPGGVNDSKRAPSTPRGRSNRRATDDKRGPDANNRDSSTRTRGDRAGKRGARSTSDDRRDPDASSTRRGAGGTRDTASDDAEETGSVVGRVVRLLGLEQQGGMLCPARAGAWRLERDGDACRAKLSIGWPDVEISIRQTEAGVRATCAIALPDDAVSLLRTKVRAPRPRIRVVSAPIGASADDLGEVVLGGRIARLRTGSPRLELTSAERGVTITGEIAIGDAVLALRASPRGVVLRGEAELFVAEPERRAWRRWDHGGEVVLDRVTLIVAGPPARRVVAQFRPARAWADGTSTVDSLLADSAGDRSHRVYPHGAAVPELGWVNPYDVDRSLGLDGWVHAYAAESAHGVAACGTLAPPAIAEEQICSTNPLDGVIECRVALQPQLALALRGVGERILREPKPVTGRDTAPVRVAFVALRGDTGEILAQGNLAAGRPALAYAPVDARAEAELMQLRDQPGEAAAEKVEWNLPIAVGSTFKPIVARAAEQAFPKQLSSLSLTAAGHADGCRKRRGVAIDPIAGHCPPTSVAGQPATADVHEFLARSPNWFQAALGLVGLGLGPDAKVTVKDRDVTFAEVVGSDLATWPADSPLTIADAQGPILGKRGVTLAGLRRTPLWTRVEGLLGRPLCTLGDRASCERAAARGDICAARALPVRSPSADLRNLVALGPDRIDPYPDSRRKAQTSVPVTEYLQLLRGGGVHAVGSLAQITDAFGRVIYDPSASGTLAASWFPAPRTGVVPAWSCGAGTGRENTVLGADGGLCGVVRPNGTAHAGVKELLADPKLVIYGAKTGTIDSLADIARNPRACARWNASHVTAAKLECGRAPLDDSLLVIAFGVVTPKGTIPITLGIQLQRAGKSAATKAAPVFINAIANYLR